MRGVVKHFLESKGYGFITGEDGKDYFFHVNEVKNQSKPITDGLPVRFEESVTPKGYKALQVDILDDDMPYEVPDYVITSKTGEVKGWAIVERGKYNLSFEAKGSPDEAKEGLKKLAQSLGITGIINLRYFKTTGEDGSYCFSIHNFDGQPVTVVRKSFSGQYQTIENIPSFDEALNNHLKQEDDAHDPKTSFIICAIILLILFIAMISPIVSREQ